MTDGTGRTVTTATGLRIVQDLGRRVAAAQEIHRLAREFDAVVTERVAMDVSMPPPEWLRVVLARRSLPAQLGEELATVYENSESGTATSLAAVVVRGLAPHSALATVPDDEWAPSLSAVNPGRAAAAPPGPIDLRQPPGRPLDYRGYLCVIAKLTRLCNLRCTYCADWSDAPGSTMSPVMVDRLVGQALGAGRRAVDFVWHGGEPLLLGTSRLVRLLATQARYAAPGQIVRNFLQTNGTVLPADTVRFLRLFDVKVSVSLDGPPPVHDASRRDRRGRPTSERVRRGIELLQENGLLTGVLVVVGPRLLSVDVGELWDFLEDTGTPTVCFLPERPRAGEPVTVTSARFVEFLLRIADVRTRRRSSIAVRELDAASAVIAGRQSGFCELAGNCVGHFVSVDPNGDVMHCDKYIGNGDFVLGNLVREDFASILAGPRTNAVRDAANGELDALRSCPHFDRCQGWCPHERHVDPRSIRDGCCGLGPLFDRLVAEREVAGDPS